MRNSFIIIKNKYEIEKLENEYEIHGMHNFHDFKHLKIN